MPVRYPAILLPRSRSFSSRRSRSRHRPRKGLDGLGDHRMAGYQNLRQGGGLTGSIAAAPTGQRNDPQAEEQQQAQMVQQRYLALKNAGIPDQKALLAAIDPEYRKMIVRDAFSSNQDLAI